MRTATLTIVLGLSAALGLAGPSSATSSHGARTPHQIGKAVWYGQQFHGRPTASGEPYDMFDLTAAHRHLPLGSVVRVTNLDNRRSVVVRINDRGPRGQSQRIIDVSYGASRRLGMVHCGVAPVRLELMAGPKPVLID